MSHGPQVGRFDLSFALPSECADRLARGEADIGIVPSAEINGLGLTISPGVGVACRGAVRSILLISKKRPEQIQSVALDASSRTSAMLTRIILDKRYGIQPRTLVMRPNLETMLAVADAALIIGDPALRLDPETLPYQVLDLGAEWMDLTGLPMVFAMWAGPPAEITPEVSKVFADSCKYGLNRIDEIARNCPAERGISAALAKLYLTRHIVFEFGRDEEKGLEQFQSWVEETSATLVSSG